MGRFLCRHRWQVDIWRCYVNFCVTHLLGYVMATDRFPYDIPSDEAMVILLNEVRPQWGASTRNTRTGNYRFLPTTVHPGRTITTVDLLDQGISRLFLYRRLAVNIAVGDMITLTIEGDVTSRKIVKELNKLRGMQFSNIDVFENDRVLARVGESITYRMRARPSSPVWYGETIITANAVPEEYPLNSRITEDGILRLTENDAIRITEEM